MHTAQYIMIQELSSLGSTGKQNETKDIYEILSKLMNELTFFMTNAHKILVLKVRGEDYQAAKLIEEFSAKLKHQELFNQNRGFSEFAYPISSSITKRLSCRIYQVVIPIKQKTMVSKSMRLCVSLCNDFENALGLFQQNQQFPMLLKELSLALNSFAQKVENLEKCDDCIFHTTHQLDLKKQSEKLQTSKVVKLQKPVAKLQKPVVKLEKPVAKLQKPVTTDSTNRFKGILSNIKARFHTFSCLDLDYSHFRSSFHEVRNQQDFYEDYLDRNKGIKTAILSYSKSYHSFNANKSKKRQKRLGLSNSFLMPGQKNLRNQAKSVNIAKNSFVSLMSRRPSSKSKEYSENLSIGLLKKPNEKDCSQNKITIETTTKIKFNCKLKNVLFNTTTQFQGSEYSKSRANSRNQDQGYTGYMQKNSIRDNRNILKNLQDLTPIIIQ